jgi:ribosomal protein L17
MSKENKIVSISEKSKEIKRVVDLINKANNDKDTVEVHIFTAIENMREIMQYVKEIGMDENKIVLHDIGDEERISQELKRGMGNDQTLTKLF